MGKQNNLQIPVNTNQVCTKIPNFAILVQEKLKRACA